MVVKRSKYEAKIYTRTQFNVILLKASYLTHSKCLNSSVYQSKSLCFRSSPAVIYSMWQLLLIEKLRGGLKFNLFRSELGVPIVLISNVRSPSSLWTEIWMQSTKKIEQYFFIVFKWDRLVAAFFLRELYITIFSSRDCGKIIHVFMLSWCL